MKASLKEQYTATIGIECHVQLKTKTKLFAAVEIADFESEPNTAISQICLGMPGALPYLNEEAVRLASKAAFALNTEPQLYSKFDRKHYFYPDLPKGYQITQFDEPIILGGFVNIVVNGENKRINITRAHIEEDAGKTIHPAGKNYSLVDLNRAGTPLLEIVSEPDMHNAEEAREFAHELYLLMKYADVSTADLYQGNMRFDVNVSVSKNNQLGTRSETKNLNSFRSVEKAVNFEIDRQIKLLEAGKKVVQETRGWDDAKQKTFSQRSKEDAHDYRYFPEPDVPPVLLSKAYVDKLRQEIKISPDHLREMLNKLNLDKSSVDTLVEEMVAGRFIVEVINHSDNAISRRISNWLTSDVQGLVSAGKLSWDTARLNVDSFIDLAKAVLDNKISSTNSKVIIEKMIIDGGSPLEIAKANNLIQMSDESELVNMAKQVLADNPKAAQDYRNGEDKVMGFLVGQVMKLSKGQANPQVSATILKDLLK